VVIFVVLLCLVALPAKAETGHDAWLRYAPIPAEVARARYASMPGTVVALGDSLVVRTARDELVRGVGSMFGRRLITTTDVSARGSAIVLGTLASTRAALPGLVVPESIGPDGFWLRSTTERGRPLIVIAGQDERGVLYGTFALLRLLALQEDVSALDERQAPAARQRWVNEWDNLDGTIERGYAGSSIFFERDRVAADLTLAGEYARLLASIGVNACTVSSVNANPRVITPEFISGLVRIAGTFRPWGIALSVAIDFSSPVRIGGLDTFDPLDPRVAGFWKARTDDIYRAIPDFAGFVLKADSEGRLGPSAYGRSHADAANVIARALAPHGGVLFYRGFVYDHHMDWQNPKNDRARAAYDNFQPLDGRFDDNVILQIKHGPIDFQVREPASPLFGALKRTNEAIELQITQEYTGQQRHVCFLVPMWKGVLDFDLQARGAGTPVKNLVSGKTFGRPAGGFVGVSNVGRSPNWLGHDLAMANLYGFGRLAWNADLSSERIADEWTRLTFGHDPRAVQIVTGILLDSWRSYERYTGPLGAGTLTDIIRVHYGPGIESSERNGWGQWHRADKQGIGMNRTVATGTGYIGQYAPATAAIFESVERCPDELLLFMHHVPYTYELKSGKTVIQHIYDSHYEGAEQAAAFVGRWRRLEGLIDAERYEAVLSKLEYQAGHAVVWRDAVCSWFLRESGIPDAKGRAGHFPGRDEAESMMLEGYTAQPVTPWETASGGTAVVCSPPRPCSVTHAYSGAEGLHDIFVQYFDQNTGASRFRLLVAGREVDAWVADADFGTAGRDGHSSTRRTIRGVPLAPGDTIRIEAAADGDEGAAIDYIEIVPSGG
jgi:alpha-glucuronidase